MNDPTFPVPLMVAAEAAASVPAAADAQWHWLEAQDEILALPVLDLRLDYGRPEPLGPQDQGPDGLRARVLPVLGGELRGRAGLQGLVTPGAFGVPRQRADGLVTDRLTLRVQLAGGDNLIAELLVLGTGCERRAVLRCVVNRGPYDWLNTCLLVGVVDRAATGLSDAVGLPSQAHIRFYAIEAAGVLLSPLAAGEGLDGCADLPPLRTEHVLNIVGTCSAPEVAGLSPHAPDGVRTELWPITGGRFRSRDGRTQGLVVPGGGDYPVIRPDGSEWVDAYYRLRTDDGATIVIHNKGFYREGATRLQPEFTTNLGPHDWLNRSLFVATLVFPVPASVAVSQRADENDRLIQVHRVL